MTELTTGQRIARCRKQLNLSQEGLGEKVGVSRQAISKWESDATLPDIDKLIALSRLFQVSVGWLLGVEEQPEPMPEKAQISEELLLKIEEIVRRSQPEKKRLSKGKKYLLILAAIALLWGGTRLIREWRDTRYQVEYLSAQIANSNRQDDSILRKLNGLESRIDSINTSVKEAAASLSSYEFKVIPNIEEQYALVELTAIPKNWNESWRAQVNVRHEGALSVAQACYWDGTALNFSMRLNLVDGLEYWLVISYPDGTQEQISLEDSTARHLHSSFSILCDATVDVSGFTMASKYSSYAHFSIDVTNLYLCRPDPEENAEDWLWTKTDYVLYRTQGNARTVCETRPILNLEEDAKIQECWISQSPGFPIEDPREGDTYELWVLLELANGVSLEQCIGSWLYSDGQFVDSPQT